MTHGDTISKTQTVGNSMAQTTRLPSNDSSRKLREGLVQGTRSGAGREEPRCEGD